MMQITPEKNAPLAVYLASDRAAHVSGQVFGVRKNEIYLYNQFDLARVVADVDGWTPNSIADVAMPGLAGGFRAARKSVVEGKSVSVRLDLGGRRIIKKN